MKLCFCPLPPRFSPNLKGGAMQDFLAYIFGSCSAPPPSSGGESSEFWENFGAIFGAESSASFGAESSLQVLGQNLPPRFGGKTLGQVLGQNLLPKFSDIISRNSLRKFSEIIVQKFSGRILRIPSVFGMF